MPRTGRSTNVAPGKRPRRHSSFRPATQFSSSEDDFFSVLSNNAQSSEPRPDDSKNASKHAEDAAIERSLVDARHSSSCYRPAGNIIVGVPTESTSSREDLYTGGDCSTFHRGCDQFSGSRRARRAQSEVEIRPVSIETHSNSSMASLLLPTPKKHNKLQKVRNSGVHGELFKASMQAIRF